MKISAHPIANLFTHNFGIVVATFVGLLIALPGNAKADHESQPQFVQLKSEALQCAADDMRDEIKAHFRKSKVYGKMLSTNSRIKFRSGAIARRVKRNPCYSSMDRDLRKLDELVHELYELYEEAIDRSIRCLDKPIVGSTVHVAVKLGGMIELTHCIMAAADGQVEATIYPTSTIYPANPLDSPSSFETLNEFGSKFERYRPNIDVAPGVLPVVPQPRLEGPRVSEFDKPADRFGKSVLKK